MVSSSFARSVVALGSLAALAGCQSGGVAADQEEIPADAPQEEMVDNDRGSNDESAGMEQAGAGFADGTYQAGGGYQSPNGAETIQVSLTITNGVIEDVTVTPQASSSTSKRYQGDFAGGVAAEVVGKALEEVDVTRVAGSSLTSGGFHEALATIRQDATVG